jgi:hypothetical protein
MAWAFALIWLDITHIIEHSAEFVLAADEYGKAASTIMQNLPLIICNTVIPYGESRGLDMLDLDPEKSYVALVNDKVLSSVSVKDKGDTVYVYDGELMTEER